VSAASFMRRHSGVLLRLSSAPGINKVASVRTLMSTVTLHGGHEEKEGKGESAEEKVGQFSQPHDSLEPETGRLLAELTAATESSDRLLVALNEIQSYSNPKPGVLIHFQEELLYHISHSSSGVRTITYNLLLKHLKQRPDCWRTILPGYLGALQSGEEPVVNSALDCLPEFSVLCQESVGLLLTTVFKLNITSNMNTIQPIISAINMLNMMAGNS